MDDKFWAKRNWFNRQVDKVIWWWWDRKVSLSIYKSKSGHYQAGMRKVEEHILDDIEFGYTTEMIASKIKHHNYSYLTKAESKALDEVLFAHQEEYDDMDRFEEENAPSDNT